MLMPPILSMAHKDLLDLTLLISSAYFNAMLSFFWIAATLALQFLHSAKLCPASAYLNMLFSLTGVLLFPHLARSDSCSRNFLVTLNTDQVLCCILPSLTPRLQLCAMIPSNRCSPSTIHKGSIQGFFIGFVFVLLTMVCSRSGTQWTLNEYFVK